MARNKVQFQRGLSDVEFERLYGTEEKCAPSVRSKYGVTAMLLVMALPRWRQWARSCTRRAGRMISENVQVSRTPA